MAELVVIDVGGTSIKYGLMQDNTLTAVDSVPTPATLDEYYAVLTKIVDHFKETATPVGVGISSPGAVNKVTGTIEGASALPYIHHFPIFPELEKRFGLPISMENDANCAALAEMQSGAGAGHQNVLFFIVGTGIGGSVIVNGQVVHGRHLFGGEFGYMLMDDTHTLSEVGTAVHMADRYNARVDADHPRTGKEVFALAAAGDTIAQEEADVFYRSLAKGIYNLTYAFDPEVVILGGGVSQADFIVPELNKRLQTILDQVQIAPFMPPIALAQHRAHANLIGAAVDYWQNH